MEGSNLDLDNFALGWLHEKEAEAKTAWTNSPPRFQAHLLGDVDISDTAFTLADQIKFWFNQGPVGSCFSNAVVQAVQLAISFAVSKGASYAEEQFSRAWVWYYGRLLDGSIGSRDDGGTITNAMRAVHEKGIVLEKDWPYKPEHNFLEKKPPQSVIDTSKTHAISGLLDLDFGDTEGIKRTIKSGLPPVMGIWWPAGWDSRVDANGIVTGIGGGRFGHALVIMGWMLYKGTLYWHICNSHGPIYHILDPTFKVPGFVGSSAKATYAFWVPDQLLKTVVGYGNAELVAPVGVISPSLRKPLSWLNAAA